MDKLIDFRQDVHQAHQETNSVTQPIDLQNLEDEQASIKRVAEFGAGELGSGAVLLAAGEVGELLAWRRERAQRAFAQQLRQMHGFSGPRHRA